MANEKLLTQYIETHDRAFQRLTQNLQENLAWVCYEVILHEREGPSLGWVKGGYVLDCEPFDVARIAGAFANEQRVRLLKALYQGYHTFTHLREQTGMKPGQLQHHLKELALGSLLVETPQRNHYQLSKHGEALLLLMCCLAKWPPDMEGGESYLSPDAIGMDELLDPDASPSAD